MQGISNVLLLVLDYAVSYMISHLYLWKESFNDQLSGRAESRVNVSHWGHASKTFPHSLHLCQRQNQYSLAPPGLSLSACKMLKKPCPPGFTMNVLPSQTCALGQRKSTRSATTKKLLKCLNGLWLWGSGRDLHTDHDLIYSFVGCKLEIGDGLEDGVSTSSFVLRHDGKRKEKSD